MNDASVSALVGTDRKEGEQSARDEPGPERAPRPHGVVVDPGFVPARGLANPHLQTLWAAYRRPVGEIPYSFEFFPTADGDLVRVARTAGGDRDGRPLVLLLHGLNGSHRSRYIHGMTAAFLNAGFETRVLEFRGVADGPQRTARSYHAGFTEDLALYVARLRRAAPERPLAAVGSSLGGNVLLRWLAETGRDAPLVWAGAVSVPFDLAACAEAFHRGSGRAYEKVLLRELRRNAARRVRRFGHPTLSAEDVLGCRSFLEFDDRYVAPLFGFRDARDYYERCSSGRVLDAIRVPTLLIQSEDDPLVPAEALPRAVDLAPDTTFYRTRAGGHVGFIEDGEHGRSCWSERVLVDALARRLHAGRDGSGKAGS
jgi:predicted alpha/beta-fold hydrolase